MNFRVKAEIDESRLGRNHNGLGRDSSRENKA